MGKSQIVERYAQAMQTRDVAVSAELMHPDIVARYPQSGEVIRGRDNYVAMLTHYPSALPEAEIASIKGGSTTAVVPSALPFTRPTVTVFGGDHFVIEGVARYPDSSVYNVVWIVRLQGGLVIEETSYFAAPFEAPDWRRPYVED